MCGRFYLLSPFALLAEEFDIREPFPEYAPSPDIVPGQTIHAITPAADRTTGGNRLRAFRWGLIPSWAKDSSRGSKMFNARCESVFEKPSFRDAFRQRRCLIPADGFYEWRKEDGARIPYLVRFQSKKPMGFAGLYEKWISPSGRPALSCTIITATANETLAPIHDRMPVIVPKGLESTWLNPSISRREDLLPILKPCDASSLEVLRLE